MHGCELWEHGQGTDSVVGEGQVGNDVFEEECSRSSKLAQSTFTSAKCVIGLSYLYFQIC